MGVGEWWGKATAVMPHGGGKGHWSMDNSPTPPQVGGGGGGGGGGQGGVTPIEPVQTLSTAVKILDRPK